MRSYGVIGHQRRSTSLGHNAVPARSGVQQIPRRHSVCVYSSGGNGGSSGQIHTAGSNGSSPTDQQASTSHSSGKYSQYQKRYGVDGETVSPTGSRHHSIEKSCIIRVCTYDRKRRGIFLLEICRIDQLLKKAEPLLGVKAHEIVLEENGVLVTENNFAVLCKEPLMLLQTGERWFSVDTSLTLKYVKNLVGGRLISICNHTREKKCLLKVQNDVDYHQFLIMASKYLNVSGKVVALEDCGVIVNDLELLNAKEKILMILENNQQWHPR